MDERTKKNLVGVHPDLVRVITEAYGKVNFVVVDGVRTVERQQDLYAQGRTKPGVKVTNSDGVKNKSNHQIHDDGYGYAVDLYADTNDNEKVDAIEIIDVDGLRKVWEVIKDVSKGLEINVEWGGNWKMKDYPHFELK